MKAFKNPTVLYTSPAFVEKIVYVEPRVESTDVETKNDYRSRVTSTLGISFLNTDGNQTVSTANISIKQLMKTINKIAENEEKILEQWYCLILEENGIPVEYCPTPHILDAELLEFEMKKDLAEFLYSKLHGKKPGGLLCYARKKHFLQGRFTQRIGKRLRHHFESGHSRSLEL